MSRRMSSSMAIGPTTLGAILPTSMGPTTLEAVASLMAPKTRRHRSSTAKKMTAKKMSAKKMSAKKMSPKKTHKKTHKKMTAVRVPRAYRMSV